MAIQILKTPRGKATFALFDSPAEYVAYVREHNAMRNDSRHDGRSWSDMSGKQAIDCVANGDLSRVEASDKFLEQFEDYALPSATRETVTSVVGSMPHVPNYIAGIPETMRFRRKATIESAPLAVVADLTSSAGIHADQVNKRGVAILAFVRAISAKRPVECWSICGLGGHKDGVTAWWTGFRLDTAPLDLARACPSLANVGLARNVGYEVCNHLGSGGSWPYNGGVLDAPALESEFRVAMPHVGDVLAIPGIMLGDKLTKDPIGWIKEKLEQYGEAA